MRNSNHTFLRKRDAIGKFRDLHRQLCVDAFHFEVDHQIAVVLALYTGGAKKKT